MNFTVDSNYLICLLQSWNSHHPATLADLERRLDQGQLLHIIPYTLLETYSVMTRMPDPFRKPPPIVASARRNWAKRPQTYDRWIAFPAHQAGMRALVTWNVRHFQPNTFTRLARAWKYPTGPCHIVGT